MSLPPSRRPDCIYPEWLCSFFGLCSHWAQVNHCCGHPNGSLRPFRCGSTMNLNVLNRRWYCCFDTNYGFHVISICAVALSIRHTIAILSSLDRTRNFDGMIALTLIRWEWALWDSVDFVPFDRDGMLPETIFQHRHHSIPFEVISSVIVAWLKKKKKNVELE